MIKAIIFDFDGVIADTMNDNCKAWQNSLSHFGVDFEPKEYFRLEGMGPLKIAQYFITKYGLDSGSETEIVKLKEQYYRTSNQFKIYPGIQEIFDFLQEKNILLALVTGASKERLNHSLDKKWKDKFTSIVTSDEVKNSKPHPEPYLRAMKELCITFNECIVIENAPLGIESSKQAGCICFALQTTLNDDSLSIADKIFPDHKTLFRNLQEILKH